MGLLPKNLFEIQRIGARTRERMVAAQQVPAFADCGLGLVGLSIARVGFTFTRLSPDMHQFLSCIAGTGEVWCSGRWHPLRTGEAYFTPAGVPHAYRAKLGPPWQVAWAVYPEHVPQSPHFTVKAPVIVTRTSPAFHRATEGLCEAVARGAGEGERELWTRLIHLHVVSATAPTGARAPRLAMVWSAVDADLAHPWTLDELARVAGMSREALRRACLQELGRSPLREVTHRRLQRAADLLRHTHDKVAAIAGRVGFGDSFAFSTAFKRSRGKSPRAYRSAQTTLTARSSP